MSNITVLLITAIGLSMDAFSLSLAYGTNNISNKLIKKIALAVGIFHFFMPLIGHFFGHIILNIIPFDPNFLIFLIFTFLSVQMFIETFSDDTESISNLIEKSIYLFAFSVSIDSFSTGIGLSILTNNHLLACMIFSIVSALFTYMGLKFGSKLQQRLGKVATILGAIALFLLGISYI